MKSDDQNLRKLLRNALPPVEPPPGYEDRLLHSLRARLPLEVPARTRGSRDSSRSVAPRARWWRRPQFSWGMTAAFALLLVLSWVDRQSREGELSRVAQGTHGNSALTGDADLLRSTAQVGGRETVDRWIASTGDAANRLRVAGQDLGQLAAEMSLERDPRVVEKALNALAADSREARRRSL